MSNPVVLITGASSGIGKTTAEQLAAQGYRVFAASRRIDRLESMRSANIEPLSLDVTSDESVAAGVKRIMERAGRIDVLVNNAGYGLYGIAEEVPHEVAHEQFEVNVFGLMRLTRAVLPIMRQQRSGRIINISSVAGKFVTPVSGWYCASKFAVEALSDAMRVEVAPFGIDVVVIEPGAIKTAFEDVAIGQLTATSKLQAYRPMVSKFQRLVQNNYRRAPGAEVVAETISRAIRANRPRTRYALPMDARMFILLRRLLSDRLLDRLLRQMFT